MTKLPKLSCNEAKANSGQLVMVLYVSDASVSDFGELQGDFR